jgi:hypothetical protein
LHLGYSFLVAALGVALLWQVGLDSWSGPAVLWLNVLCWGAASFVSFLAYLLGVLLVSITFNAGGGQVQQLVAGLVVFFLLGLAQFALVRLVLAGVRRLTKKPGRGAQNL